MILDFLLNYLPLIAGVLLGVSYLYQIGHLYKTKKTDGISVTFWVIISIALFMLLVNSIVIFVQFGTWGYMVTEIFNTGLAITVLLMVLYYRSKENSTNSVKKN